MPTPASALAALAVATAAAAAPPVAALREHLRQTLGPAVAAHDTKVIIAWQDLNGDGRPEALVYVTGRNQCGSGGCNLEVLEQSPTGFRSRGHLTISRPPIGVLDVRTQGWRHITVWIAGGGVTPGYVAEVPFRGDRYAGNPTVPPARALAPGVTPQALIGPNTDSEPLFSSAER
jgi:hypothetical protein